MMVKNNISCQKDDTGFMECCSRKQISCFKIVHIKNTLVQGQLHFMIPQCQQLGLDGNKSF